MKKMFLRLISAVLAVVMLFTTSVVAYAEDNRYGVDISYHNGVVSFSDLQNDGKSFVMIRLGYYNHLDTKFWDNVKAANDANMDYGVYLYSHAESVEEAKIEARFVLQTLSQLGDYARCFTMPVAYDLEDSKIASYGKAQLTQQMTTFLDIIKNAGYTPMVYANLNWFNNYIDINTAKQYKLWYANWKLSPDTNDKVQIGTTGVFADMLQYAKGGSGSFDLNVLYNPSEIIKPLSCYHTYTKVINSAPSCQYEGLETWTCSKCGNQVNIALPKQPHSKVKDAAVSATYFTTGKTAGSHCAYCGTVITKQKKVDKKKAKLSNLTANKKGLTVKWGKISNAKGYEIQYSTSKSFTKKTTKTLTVNKNKTTSIKITKLKSKKKYYVRIRAYKMSGKKKVYSSYSGIKSEKTK